MKEWYEGCMSERPAVEPNPSNSSFAASKLACMELAYMELTYMELTKGFEPPTL
jgi:hypothetical protein